MTILSQASSKEVLVEDEVVVPRDGCPNSCSGNGRCAVSTCQCNAGWTGIDCSIADTALLFGSPTSSSVLRKQWHYFHTAYSGGGGITWTMTQNSASADCDLYVQLNAYPSQFDYLDRDISADQSVQISVNPADGGTWYAGVFGYTDCAFTIRIDTVASCPNACSGHGVCDAGNATCTCDATHTGDDCSVAIAQLTTGQTLAGQQVDLWAWNYYYYNNTGSADLLVTVNQASATEDCDMYIKAGALPSYYSYDYRDQSTMQSFVVRIPSPLRAVYYVGIFGWSACSYSIGVSTPAGCVSACSGTSHGQCVASTSTCSCSAGYTGAYCEQSTVNMSSAATYAGQIDASLWNYYSLAQGGTGNAVVTLTQTSGACSLYVRANANPTLSAYQFISTGTAATKTVTIPQPAGAVWKIGVFGSSSCAYTLAASFQTSCPGSPPCSNQGSCSGGLCYCNSGWTGLACDRRQTNLASNVTLVGSIGLGQWNYYSVSNVQSALTVHVFETTSTGAVWLFAGSSQVSLQNSDYHVINSHSKNHNIVIPRLSASAPTTYYIGIYGAPVIAAGQTVPYSISAFLTPW